MELNYVLALQFLHDFNFCIDILLLLGLHFYFTYLLRCPFVAILIIDQVYICEASPTDCSHLLIFIREHES